MIKFILLYLLLMVSLVFPPLLFLSLPMLYLYVRGIVRRRRAILNYAEAIQAERRIDRTVKFFR